MNKIIKYIGTIIILSILVLPIYSYWNEFFAEKKLASPKSQKEFTEYLDKKFGKQNK